MEEDKFKSRVEEDKFKSRAAEQEGDQLLTRHQSHSQIPGTQEDRIEIHRFSDPQIQLDEKKRSRSIDPQIHRSTDPQIQSGTQEGDPLMFTPGE